MNKSLCNNRYALAVRNTQQQFLVKPEGYFCLMLRDETNGVFRSTKIFKHIPCDCTKHNVVSFIAGKSKGKVHPRTGHEGQKGE